MSPEALPHIELVVAGSVAVNRRGARVGKGGGYTTVVTTVHDLQVARGAISMTAHDVPLDVVVTPTRTLRVPRRRARPQRIRWNELDDAQLAAMPALSKLRR